ncbi:succinate dehydrogenase iron-sulfur subunit [Candidatus Sumerlaeota bacterium]|nr:succinate dehydrogenase iron-sulfur subunit [Candidatus Sumerlaeota bacterium]
MADQSIELRVRRQDGPRAAPRWEHFTLPLREGMTVITCLREIARNPFTIEGRSTPPVQWESACLEEKCGSCTMRINGEPRAACTALIATLDSPIELEPLAKFPVIRDLVVDRRRMTEDSKQVQAWVPLDGIGEAGEGPSIAPELQRDRYELSGCMNCGCCLEVCPQVNSRSGFIGPAAVAQVKLFNLHPIGKMIAAERLETMMGEGGVHQCGNAQNCLPACPVEIRLTDAIGEISRQVTVHAVKKFFGRG